MLKFITFFNVIHSSQIKLNNMKSFQYKLLILLLFMGCTTKSPLSNRYVSKKKNIQHLVELGKSHWERRVDLNDAKLSNHFLSKAIELDPKNSEIMALFSRSCYFIGRFINNNSESSDSIFMQGYTKSWGHIIASEAFQNGFESVSGDSVAKTIAGLENLSEELLPVAYWWAENYTSYLLTKPVLQRIESREIIETVIHHILSVNPEYNYHGANRIFGTFYAKLPGVNLDQSKSNFDKSISIEPNFMTSYTLRAQYFSTKAGDEDLFIKDLQLVLNADPTKLPEASPENLFEQEKAKYLLSRKESLFE